MSAQCIGRQPAADRSSRRHWHAAPSLLIGTGIAAASIALALVAGQARSLPPKAYDFIEEFPTAAVRTETAEIDFGTAAARPHLIDGWSHDERNQQYSFVWGTGDHSTLVWFLIEPRDLTLRFRCWPLAAKSRRQTITVAVNEQTLQTIELGPRGGTYSVPVPAEALRPGDNRALFGYAYHRTEQDPQAAGDLRPLAVAWDWLRLENVTPPDARPHITTVGTTPALALPMATRVDYYLDIAPESTLAIGGVVPREGKSKRTDGPNLQVELQLAGTDRAKTFELPQALPPARQIVHLAVESPQIARLSFRVQPTSKDAPGLVIIAPTLYGGPQPPPTTAPAAAHHAPSDGTMESTSPNVILYLIDALRADHLGCYGYDPPTSPHIDAFASEAVLFTRAIAQSSWTRSSVASIFTGLDPRAHGANGREDGLAEEVVTIAELLRQAGYATAGFVANGNVAPSMGFGQGFEVYKLMSSGPGQLARADELNEPAFRWLASRTDGRPFFLYLHSIDPHSPYTPAPAYRQRFAPSVTDPETGSMQMIRALENLRQAPSSQLKKDLIALYDAEVASNDAAFGTLVAHLKASGLCDSALIILVADHGEEFLDHGDWEHGKTLYWEQLRVPLIIKLPKGNAAGRTILEPAQHIDLLPTILAFAGLEMPVGLHGNSLLPAVQGANSQQPRAFSYLNLDGREAKSVIVGGMKLISHQRQRALLPRPPVELFDSAADPAEHANLAFEQPVKAGYLAALIAARDRQLQAAPRSERVVLPASVKEQLRALGYLD